MYRGNVQYQLVRRALAGYIYYELYHDIRLVGNIKKADIVGAPIRIRGKDFDVISEVNHNDSERKKYYMLWNNLNQPQAEITLLNERINYRNLNNDSNIEVKISRDYFSCVDDNVEIIKVNMISENPYVLKGHIEKVDNIIGLQRVTADDSLSDMDVMLLLSVILMDFNSPIKVEMVRCNHCMELFNKEYGVCPKCGFDIIEKPENNLALRPGTILADRYYIGEMFFAGGSYLLYYSWDNQSERKVVVREFFPKNIAKRVYGEKTVVVYPEECFQDYVKELDNYMDEKNEKLQVYDETYTLITGFEENFTGYLVYDSTLI